MSDRQEARRATDRLGRRGWHECTRAHADDAEGVGDSCADAGRDHGRVSQVRPAQAQALTHVRSRGCVQQVAKHRVLVATVVVPPRVRRVHPSDGPRFVIYAARLRSELLQWLRTDSELLQRTGNSLKING